MKNNDSFMTRQQYRQMKSRHHSFYNQFSGGIRHHMRKESDSSFREFKIKRLSKRLDKIIAIIILLIVIVYLVLVFVNF